MTVLLVSACSINTTPLSSEKKIIALTAEEEKLYHQRFDLSDIQIEELRTRGYEEKAIAKMDNVDFLEAEKNWVICDEQIIKGIYPELQNVDISKWTNADLQAYGESITKKEQLKYAPTPEQIAELEKRGISLDIAHKMLKDYINYNNLLAQSESTLNKFKEQIVEADKLGEDYLKKMNEIRAKYKKSHY